MANWIDSNLAASLVGVGGTLAGILVGSWIATRQQRADTEAKTRSYISAIGMELEDQSTAILNVSEYLQYLGPDRSIPSKEIFGLSRHLPGTPHVFRGLINNLVFLNPDTASYLVQYHSEIERARETTFRIIDVVGLTKSKALTAEEFELLTKKWRSAANMGYLVIIRLLACHEAAIPANVGTLLRTSAKLLSEASAGKLEDWEHPDV